MTRAIDIAFTPKPSRLSGRCISRTKEKPSSFTGVSGTVTAARCDFAKVQLPDYWDRSKPEMRRGINSRSGLKQSGWKC